MRNKCLVFAKVVLALKREKIEKSFSRLMSKTLDVAIYALKISTSPFFYFIVVLRELVNLLFSMWGTK